jgi:hypothetical protein
VTDEDIVKALTRIDTKLEYIEQSIVELRSAPSSSKLSVLPVTGGLVGLIAAACTGYLQATGHA